MIVAGGFIELRAGDHFAASGTTVAHVDDSVVCPVEDMVDRADSAEATGAHRREGSSPGRRGHARAGTFLLGLGGEAAEVRTPKPLEGQGQDRLAAAPSPAEYRSGLPPPSRATSPRANRARPPCEGTRPRARDRAPAPDTRQKNNMHSAPPSENPRSTACREPVASRTARRSSMRSSSEGSRLTGSERPVPRLSNSTTRPMSVRALNVPAVSGNRASARKGKVQPSTRTISTVPAPAVA